jgi:hypothetical protein
MFRIFLIALTLFVLVLPSSAEPEEPEAQSKEVQRDQYAEKDSPFVVTGNDVDDGQIKLENDFIYSHSRGGADTFQIPILLRVDTGPETEFRFRHDFLTYSDPTLGFGDTAIGFKWSFIEDGDQDLAIVGEIEFPSGSAGFEANAIEFLGVLAYDHKIGPDWEWAINFDAASIVGADNVRFTVLGVTTQFAYSIGEDELSLGVEMRGPHQRVDGTTLTSLNLGYSHNIGEGADVTFNLGRRLSGEGSDILFIVGFGRTF